MRFRLSHILIALLLLPTCVFGQTVKIGDILCTDGSTVRPEQYAASGRTAEGIVFYVDRAGTHGWAVSLNIDALDTDWVTQAHYYDEYDIPDLPNCEYSREALYDMNGRQNTAVIRAAHGPDWYPAAWAVDFDNGWYLPAAGQMRWLLAYVNEINASLAVVGGSPFVLPHPDWHWTSTEYDDMHAVIVSRTGSVSNYMKWNYYDTYTIGVRAIKDFDCNSTPEHNIGEVVTAPGGQAGIVFYVSPDDGSYWLTALNDLPTSYSWGDEEDIPELDNIADEMSQWYGMQGIYCGYDATMKMRNAQGSNPAYAAHHVDFGNGWHIPSTGQLSKLYAALPHIEEALLGNGGSLPSGDLYWTSTENLNDKAWAIDFGSSQHLYQEGRFVATSKETQCKVRPVWSLPCEGPCPTGEPIEIDIDGTECSSFTFNDSTYYESGLYEQLVENPAGCDTLYHINVSLGETAPFDFWRVHCYSYTWNDSTYTESGVYQQTFELPNGCDSVAFMHLQILDTIRHEWEIEACDRYTWNGVTYTEPGDYVQSFEADHGCDSIVTLHLTFSESLETDADTTACGSFSWNGQEHTGTGVIDSLYITIGGCDSLVHLHYTVMPYPAAVGPIEGPTEVYVSTDLIYGKYFYSIAPVAFADHYEWELDGADWPMDADGLQCAVWVITSGTATLRVKAWNGCGYTEQEILLHATFFDVDENQAIQVAMYPNPACDWVDIVGEGIQRVRLFNLQGQLLAEQNGNENIKLTLNGLATSIYLVEVETQQGRAILKLNVIH